MISRAGLSWSCRLSVKLSHRRSQIPRFWPVCDSQSVSSLFLPIVILCTILLRNSSTSLYFSVSFLFFDGTVKTARRTLRVLLVSTAQGEARVPLPQPRKP